MEPFYFNELLQVVRLVPGKVEQIEMKLYFRFL